MNWNNGEIDLKPEPNKSDEEQAQGQQDLKKKTLICGTVKGTEGSSLT